MREQPEQQAPPVQRLRIRYAKRGRMRFTSHRDFSRAFERAVFRARIPMAYSSGFNPHPRISYAGAAPTGSASEAEYLEIALAERVEPAQLHETLAATMPEGLDLLEVVEARAGALADRLQASQWAIDLPLPLERAQEAVQTFLAADEIVVERMTKKGIRSFDCRAAVASMTAEATDTGSRLQVVIQHGTPTVRPDDVISGLEATAGLKTGADHGGVPLLTRLAQGPFDADSGIIGDPLA